MNSEISYEQENKINEILEKGIDQIKHRTSARKEKKERNLEDNLKVNKEINESISKKNDEMIKSNVCDFNKKNHLKNFLEKFRKEENKFSKKSPIKESDSKSIDINDEKATREDNISLNGEKILKIKGRNPKNVSNIKKELSTLQSTIDNLEKKLFDNASLSLNSPLSNLSYEKFYRLNENLSSENNDETIHRHKSNDLSMMEYTKQILEKNNNSRSSLYKTETPNKKIPDYSEFVKTNLNYDKNGYADFISNTKFLGPENENLINSFKNTKPTNYLNKSEAFTDHIMRINFLEKCIKEKENIIHDLKNEINNLLYDKENLSLKLSQEKKKNLDLESEFVKYKNVMKENEELKFKLIKLTDDYNVMCNKYNRSEHIRYQQSNIIHALQREIDMMRNRQIQDAIENKIDVITHNELSDRTDNKINKDETDEKVSDKSDNKNKKKIKKQVNKSHDNTQNKKSYQKKKVIKRSKSKKRA